MPGWGCGGSGTLSGESDAASAELLELLLLLLELELELELEEEPDLIGDPPGLGVTAPRLLGAAP